MDIGTSPIKYSAMFIGSNPSNKTFKNSAFDMSTKSGITLNSWLDKLHISTVYFTNVYNWSTPNNRPLTKSQIVLALPSLKDYIDFYQENGFGKIKLVAVGKTAGIALTLLGVPFFELPHPSGLNRQLNDPNFIEEKLKDLKLFLEVK